MANDHRLEVAKMMPIAEVADKLGLTLRRITATEKAGPCPSCGGHEKRDADRFAINTAKNVFGCRRCGAGGDGLALVMLDRSCDFPAALTFLAGEADVPPDPKEIERRREQHAAAERRRAEQEARARDYAIRAARAIWAAAEGFDVTPAAEYLAGRGIRFASWPPTLRFHPALVYARKIDGRLRELHRGPAMVAAVQDRAGRVRAVHQTWIDPARPGRKAEILNPDTGERMPQKLVRGSKKGGAIRLAPFPPPGGCLVMGEGIETTASVMITAPIEGASYWAGVDLGNMAGRQIKIPGKRYSGEPDLEDGDAFLPPEGLSRLVFLQDGDSDPKATRAKLLSGLRRARALCGVQRVEIAAAPEGMDFNDVLQGGSGHAAD